MRGRSAQRNAKRRNRATRKMKRENIEYSRDPADKSCQRGSKFRKDQKPRNKKSRCETARGRRNSREGVVGKACHGVLLVTPSVTIQGKTSLKISSSLMPVGGRDESKGHGVD